MFKFKIGFAIFCITFFGIILFFLIINWNAETWAPSLTSFITALLIWLVVIIGRRQKKNWATKLSALIAFIPVFVTMFITLGITFKESNIDKKTFTISIFINEETRLPAFILPSKSLWLSEVSSLAIPNVTMGNEIITIFELPKELSETITFYEELLQYMLLRDIRKLQRESQSLSQSINSNPQFEYHKPYKLSEITDYSGKDFLDIILENRFANSPIERFDWELTTFRLPPKTKLILKRIPFSNETGVEKHEIIFRRPYYFTIKIIIEHSPLITTLMAVPDYINISDEEAKKYKIYPFIITMEANFDKYTAGNWRTEEYRKWVNWLFSEIQNKYSDEKKNLK